MWATLTLHQALRTARSRPPSPALAPTRTAAASPSPYAMAEASSNHTGTGPLHGAVAADAYPQQLDSISGGITCTR